MPEKKKLDELKIQIDRLTLRNKRLNAQNAALDEELTFAKTALIKIKAGYAARVRNTLKMDIQDVLGCKDNELRKLTDGKDIDELEAMFQNFATAVDATKSPYDPSKRKKTASIRPGTDAVGFGAELLTVGNLFGKTPKEIREMKGDM